MNRSRLVFFCELEAEPLQALFADPGVTADLVALGAEVSLGILDLSAQRAAVVRHLTQAGIPVTAWPLLSKAQGYWFNLGNAAQAAARYGSFRAWTAEQDLSWAGLGLDIEVDIREAQQLLTNKWRLAPTLLRRAVDGERLRRAQAEYSALVARMHADGYHVESYVIPLILDEREAGSTFLQRVSGVVDIPADREVAMLYTSFLRPRGPGILWSYAQEVQAVGLGVTGGGVQIDGMPETKPLDWNEFARDLRLARRWSSDLYVFSLEGCVHQGFLSQLRAFDWEQPITPPLEPAKQVARWRQGIRTGLWLSAHPLAILGSLIGALWLLPRLRRRG